MMSAVRGWLLCGAILAIGLAAAPVHADWSHSDDAGDTVKPTGLVPIYPDGYVCSPLTSLYASWIDIDGTARSEQHTGVDGGHIRDWIVAPADGKVRAVWKSNWGWGWEGSLIISHTREDVGLNTGAPLYYSVFDHLNFNEISDFEVGEEIERGQRLARVYRPGGKRVYLPEVHWEVWQTTSDELEWTVNEHGGPTWFNRKAKLVDPLVMLQLASGESGGKEVEIVPHAQCEPDDTCTGFTYILPCHKKR